MVKARKLGLVGLLGVGVMSLFNGGCAEVAGGYIGSELSRSQHKNDVVRETPHPTFIYNGREDNKPIVDSRKFFVWVYKDQDGDNLCNYETEVLSELTGPINLEDLGLAVHLSNSIGEVKYSSWDSEGRLLGEARGEGGKYFCTGKNVYSGDFLDELNGSPDGEYLVTAFNNGKTFSKKVIINRGDYSPKGQVVKAK